MTKFEVMFDNINQVEVTKETDKSVWIKLVNTFTNKEYEDRRLKNNSWRPIFDTWEEAHKHLLKTACDEIERCKRNLLYAEEYYNKIESKVKPQ
jgi:hypothetical protein